MKKSINWSYFPKTDPLPEVLNETINIFEKNQNKIDSTKNDTNKLRLSSDKVLKVVEQDFIDAGFSVETGKKKDEKIRVPVLYGHQGTIAQAFEVDGWHKEQKIVLEIEAGRAYSNHQFLKDIFEASVMVNTDYLVLAVRNIYNKQKDYQIIRDWLDTLFITKRIKFELKGILLIGY
tara:strand:+ start:126 stop:656 length:531 start_codon:yes stop_codon:yes gene_type:complete